MSKRTLVRETAASVVVWIYPWLIAAYAVLTLYASNADQLPISVVTAPLIGALLLAVLLYLVSRVFCESPQGARLLTAVGVVSFFAYGHLYSALYESLRATRLGTTPNTSLGFDLHLILSALVLFVLVLARRALRRTTRDLATAELFTAIFGLLLISIPILSIVFGQHGERVETRRISTPIIEDGTQPDIYLLVFDGYPRADALEFAFDFNNEPFQDSLRNLGFAISDEARSNYLWTFLSLSSMLNMEYLDSLAKELGPDSNDRRVPFQSIRRNRVTSLLKDLGYTYVHMNSTWNGTSSSNQADVFLSCGNPALDPFQALVIQTTWLSVIDTWMGSQLAQCHLENFEKVAKVARLPGPKFVFAHFIPPHHPYLFNEDGGILKEATVADQFQGKTLWDEPKLFVGQLRFINKKILGLAEDIIDRQERESVILLISDHGIRPNLRDADAALAVRFASFTAYRTPKGDQILPNDITPVNLFRLVFNRYFDTDYTLFPKRHYASSWDKPYAFTPFSAEADSVFFDR